MAKRDELVKAYIGALDAGVVSILVDHDDKSGLCVGPVPNENPFDALWFAKPQHAELVMAQCPEGWVDLTPAALRDEVVNAAAALGAKFRTAEEVRADAEKVVEEMVEKVEVMRQSGQLTKVNRDYKIYRQAQVALGRKAVPYQCHLDAFTRSLVVLAAQKSNGL